MHQSPGWDVNAGTQKIRVASMPRLNMWGWLMACRTCCLYRGCYSSGTSRFHYGTFSTGCRDPQQDVHIEAESLDFEAVVEKSGSGDAQSSTVILLRQHFLSRTLYSDLGDGPKTAEASHQRRTVSRESTTRNTSERDYCYRLSRPTGRV